jgi:hydrogenase maturation protease
MLGQIMIIGYGNCLRRDDAAGCKVAEAIATWQFPQLRSLVVHQLTPELAAELAEVELVIFIDAYAADTIKDPVRQIVGGNRQTSQVSLPMAEVIVKPITAIENGTVSSRIGHIADPVGVLALSKVIYGKLPTAWQILIPAIDFGFGDRLSPLAQQGIEQAKEEVEVLINRYLSS